MSTGIGYSTRATLHGWMDGLMDGWVNGWKDGWMDGLINGWKDGWMPLSDLFDKLELMMMMMQHL